MNPALRVVLAVGALAVIAIAAYLLYPFVSKHMPSTGGTASLQSLTLYLPEPWTSPNGEYVSGIVSYEPATGKAIELMALDLPFVRFIIPGTLSPNGDEVLAVGYKSLEPPAGGVLGALSISKQGGVRTYIGYDTSTFAEPVWAPDGGRVAYAILGSEEGEGASLHIVPTYEGQPEYGSGFPIAFSPDGLSVLVREPLSLVIVNAVNGQRTAVTGMEDTSAVRRFEAYPGAPHIVAFNKDGSISFFAIDWEAKSASLVGTGMALDAAEPIDAAFGPDGALLILQGTTGYLYALKGDRYVAQGTLEVQIPAASHLLGWTAKRN